jgi:hypothetical protein
MYLVGKQKGYLTDSKTPKSNYQMILLTFPCQGAIFMTPSSLLTARPPPTMNVPLPFSSNHLLLLCHEGRFSGSSSSFLHPLRQPPPCLQFVPAHFIQRAYSAHRPVRRFFAMEKSASVCRGAKRRNVIIAWAQKSGIGTGR